MKNKFLTTNPLYDLRDRALSLQKKNDKLTFLVVLLGVISIATLAFLLISKYFNNECDCTNYDDFDLFDDDFEDFEDLEDFE